MTVGDVLIGRPEIAAKLGVEVEYLYRHLAHWRRSLDFPDPVLPNKWSLRAVDAWIAARSRASRETVVAVAAPPVEMMFTEDLAAELAENARSIAGH